MLSVKKGLKMSCVISKIDKIRVLRYVGFLLQSGFAQPSRQRHHAALCLSLVST